MNVIWKVTPQKTPTVLRRCNKCCARVYFECSNVFRINAQGKSLDIWLIYKCPHCSSTWNMTIYSRIKPNDIPASEYQKYMDNDVGLAYQWAFDKSILVLNNAVLNYDDIDILIEGNDVNPEDCKEPLEMHIVCNYNLEIRLIKILKRKLGLSNTEIGRLIESGNIYSKEIKNISKAKLNRSVKVYYKTSTAR